MAFMDGMTDEQKQMMQLGSDLSRTSLNIAKAFQSDLAAMTERAEKAERALARAQEIHQEAFRVSVDQARELVEARDEIRRLQAELRQARVEVEGS